MVKKVIRKNKLITDDNWMYARQECGIHEQVSNHGNIVKLYDHGETDTEFQMYMEYCDKANSLTDKIREVSELTQLSLVSKVVRANLRCYALESLRAK